MCGAVIAAVTASKARQQADIARSTSAAVAATSEVNAALASTRESEANLAQATAVVARATSEVNAELAAASEQEAVLAREETERLKLSIQASQLAEGSRAELENDPELALLLASAGYGLRQQADTEGRFYEAVFSPFRATLRGHSAGIFAAAFSPDGERIVTGSQDGTARLWDLSGNQLIRYEGISERVSSASFSPNGQQIVTAGCDEINEFENCIAATAQIWDLSGNELARLEGHTDWIRSAVFSPDGDKILTHGSEDGTAPPVGPLRKRAGPSRRTFRLGRVGRLQPGWSSRS